MKRKARRERPAGFDLVVELEALLHEEEKRIAPLKYQAWLAEGALEAAKRRKRGLA